MSIPPPTLRACALGLLLACPFFVSTLVAQAPTTAPRITLAVASPARLSSLSGVVRDTAGWPIPYVTVFVADGDGVVADDSGTFHLEGAPAGKVLFGARRLGYAPVYFEVEMPTDTTVHVVIRMRPVVQRLREVTVEEKMRSIWLARTGFYDRQQSGWGTFLLVDEIQRRAPRDLAALFYDLSGVYIQQADAAAIPMALTGSGVCEMAIYMDGVRLKRDGRGLFAIPPTTVKAIEVYPRASLTPAQFRRADDRCGAVVLWTRID